MAIDASDPFFATKSGCLDEIQEPVHEVMSSTEVVARELWGYLQDMLEKTLSDHVQSAITQAMAKQIPDILHQFRTNQQDRIKEMSMQRCRQCHAEFVMCADQDLMGTLPHACSEFRSKAALHIEQSLGFVQASPSEKWKAEKRDHASVEMVETMNCNDCLEQKMQDTSLHKCSRCQAGFSLHADQNTMVQVQSCKESNHVTVEMVEAMNCNKILEDDDLVEDCSECSSCHDVQQSDSLKVCSSPLENALSRESGPSWILPGWIPNIELNKESQSPINVTSVDSVRKVSERNILRSALYSQSHQRVDTSRYAQKAMLENSRVSRALERYWAVWGHLAWSSSNCSRWYRRLGVLTSLCCTGTLIVNLYQQPGKIFENSTETALSASCLLGLVGARRLDILIGHKDDLLKRYAASHGFLPLWNRRSMRRLALFITLWLCKAAAHIVRMFTSEDPILSCQFWVPSVIIFQAGSYFAMLHCAFHVTSFLELMLDDWTVDFHKYLDCVHGAVAWDKIQALMQRVAGSVEMIFFVVQTSALISIICCVARVLDIFMVDPGGDQQTWRMVALLEFLPTLIMVVCALAWFAKATAITEKGLRIPPVVNSLMVEPNTPITSKHQFFVGFIKNSDIGFYWKGSRLDATVFINYCYICGAVICAVFTTALKFAPKN